MNFFKGKKWKDMADPVVSRQRKSIEKNLGNYWEIF